MPVLDLRCPDCGHEFRSLVMEGCKVPDVWVCSACGSRRARPTATTEITDHPWSGGPSCGCCS
jgi:ribosomal protein L37AE/L43A